MIGISDNDFEKILEFIPKSRTSEIVQIIARTRQFSDNDISLLLAGGRTDELMEKLKLCKGP